MDDVYEGRDEASWISYISEMHKESEAWIEKAEEAAQSYLGISKFVAKIPGCGLESIVISARNISWKTKHMLEFWSFYDRCIFTPDLVPQLEGLIEALEVQGSQPKVLVHDALPFGYFEIDSSKMLHTEVFSKLKKLHLTLNVASKQYPTIQGWKRVGCLLKSLPELADLRIGFQAMKEIRDFTSIWYLGPNLTRWYVNLQSILKDHVWPCLRQLRFDGMLLCERGLGNLLVRHAKTLEHLTLSSTALWSGTFEGVLTKVRANLKLKSFRIAGVTRAFHSANEAWVLPPTQDHLLADVQPELKAYLTTPTKDSYWIRVNAWNHEGCVDRECAERLLKTGVACFCCFKSRELSDFATGKGLDQWPARFYRKFVVCDDEIETIQHSHSCALQCVMTDDEIDRLWGDDDD